MVRSQRGIRFWSPYSIDMAKECFFRWYLRYVEGIKPAGSKGALEKGTHVHERAKEFFYLKDRSYDSPESFADFAKRSWWVYLDRQYKQISEGKREPIIWKDEKKEPGIRSAQIRNLAVPMFDLMVRNGKPESVETDFQLEIPGLGLDGGVLGLSGKIDAFHVRDNKIVIVDYKTGKPLNETNINYGTQPTVYTLALLYSGLARHELAKKVGLSKEEARHLLQNPDLIKDRIQFEYQMLENKFEDEDDIWRVEVKVAPTTRGEAHFQDLIRFIWGMEKSFRDGTIKPALGKRACHWCEWREPCEKRAMQLGYLPQEQIRLPFEDYSYRFNRLSLTSATVRKKKRRKPAAVTATPTFARAQLYKKGEKLK